MKKGVDEGTSSVKQLRVWEILYYDLCMGHVQSATAGHKHFTFPSSFTNKGQSFRTLASFLDMKSFCSSGISFCENKQSSALEIRHRD